MRVRLLFTAVLAAASVAVSINDGVKDALGKHFASSAEVASEGAEGETADHEDAEHADEHHAASEHEGGEGHHAIHKIIVTSPELKDVTLTEQYVCQIHSRRHIEIRALEEGYLEEVAVNEGQTVKEGDLLFKVLPTLYQARLDADLAEAKLAQVEYDNTKKLVDQNVVSSQEAKLAEAKLAKAQAKVAVAKAELGFASIKAPFDGIIDRLQEQKGSLLEEGASLTTLSDNEVMWVYFNVPEARYLEYQEVIHDPAHQKSLDIELRLANHQLFSEKGTIGAIEAEFNNETGNIDFRADFPNPNRLLRHGQTGTILIHHVQPESLVIPQRATFEILAKMYVYVVDDESVVHQREVKIQNEQDDVFIVASGLDGSERIVLEGLGQVRDGDKVEFEFQDPSDVLTSLKYHAE
ncbi:MAG: efflux RND transporter periplasmic adaptor subunit [Planctomycetales bacterium]|nr:efflux RND transporter periplasmic adaptor subunit [Planctomycetales bacterium]